MSTSSSWLDPSSALLVGGSPASASQHTARTLLVGAYIYTRKCFVTTFRQIGHLFRVAISCSAQSSQQQTWPQGTNAHAFGSLQ